MPRAARPVFISYARRDASVVMDAVEFLNSGGLKTYVDSRNIEYGNNWEDALHNAIERCERVMVFWTAAAAVSDWVRREWEYALLLGKKVVPTLLDHTPLPPPLAKLQAVTALRRWFAPSPAEDSWPEFRRSPGPVSGPATVFDAEDEALSKARVPRWLVIAGGLLVGMAVVGVVAWFGSSPSSAPHGLPPPVRYPPASAPIPSPPMQDDLPFGPITWAGSILVLVGLMLLARRTSRVEDLLPHHVARRQGARLRLWWQARSVVNEIYAA